MEIGLDWKRFEEVFSPPHTRKRIDENAPLFLLMEQGRVLCTFSEGQDTSEFNGATRAEILKAQPHRIVLFFEREELDAWVRASLKKPHYYHQVYGLRREAADTLARLPVRQEGAERKRVARAMNTLLQSVSRGHFLLELIESGWRRFFPTRFGVCVRLVSDRGIERDFLVVVKDRDLESFHVPSLTFLGNRSDKDDEVRKYLSEKFLAPTVVIRVRRTDWENWSYDLDPWSKVLHALRRGKAKLTGGGLSLRGLIRVQTWFY